ncbi:hypothetical protein [Zobellia galactanivorans]|uniref:hypothetical protein n=1 Tax=Zobellia galactanivorans (strain DSM 12802 / CCUG 47099 / CIP 106680 / NCIMB 13871 / Dsij) TaxID=63186 RepID=UPI001C06FAB0|nr:hypothetical protein [Zobellia galactanivorans]MBU3027792.1 hypothetical protein [Zobellia galactanivorans]
MSKKTFYLSFVSMAVLFSCSKEEASITNDNVAILDTSIESRTMSLAVNEFTDTKQITAYAELAKEVLLMAKASDFRSYVYENAHQLSEAGDDYLVYVDDMTKKLSTSSKFGKSTSNIKSLSAKIKSLDESEIPMIFYPRAETLEDLALSNKGFDVAKNMNEPIVVLKGAHNADYSAPGYKLNDEGELEYAFDVNEEYAWENDVYVIGAAEYLPELDNIGEDLIDTKAVPPFTTGKNSASLTAKSKFRRVNGEAEHGAWIQVTDLNGIESWFSGKLEMRQVVAGTQGAAGTIVAETSFGRVKRKYFKDDKWVKFNASFLFNWNLNNLGDYNVEKWIEEDGGPSAEISISIPGSAYKPATSTTPSQPAIAGTTVKVSAKKDDDDLGSRIVQFSDNRYKRYDLGKMKFIRYEGN